MRSKVLISLVLAAETTTLLGLAGAAFASSHREAPQVSQLPAVDNTDVYFFVSPDDPGTVTVIANFNPLQQPAGGPNFHRFDDAAKYFIYFDNDGDAREDITYQFTFDTRILNGNTFLYNTGPITSLDDPDYNMRQSFTVRRIADKKRGVLASGLVVPPANIGPASTPNYPALADAAIYTLPHGERVFCGPRDDPFFVDLGGVFDLLTIRQIPGDMGGGKDGVAGYNCHTIAMQIPIELLTRDGSVPKDPASAAAVIGAWSAASLPRRIVRVDGGRDPLALLGADTQVSRLGMPLVNEVVIPLRDKDLWNNSRPREDAQFLSYVTDPEVAVLLNLLYGLNVPLTGRTDLVKVFLTGIDGLTMPSGVTPSEQMRLNVAIPPTARDAEGFSPLGVLGGNLDGFPNGRRLEDDTVDIELRAVAGVTYKLLTDPDWVLDPLANRLGDGVDANDLAFLPAFPYMAHAQEGFADGLHNITSARQRPIVSHEATASPTRDVASASAAAAVGNAPNPFNPTTKISFEVTQPGAVRVEIFDARGRLVRGLVNETRAVGLQSAVWDGRDDAGLEVGSGAYFYRVQTPAYQTVRQMMLLK